MLATSSLESGLLVSPLLRGPARHRPFAPTLHLHQHKSSRNLHLQYSSKSQSTPCCQSLITARSDHPPVLGRSGPQGVHSIWNAILQIAFSIWFFYQDNTSTIEDLQEKNSRTLGNNSRRLQDYSRISWSTFQPRDDSSALEDFRLVELGDARGLLENILLDYKVLGSLSYGHPWAHYSGGYQERLLGGPLGLLDLCYTAPVGVERKDYRGIVLG
jgi:hypothetical protein